MGTGERFSDDITGQPLPSQLVVEARRKELAYFESKGGSAHGTGPKGKGRDREAANLSDEWMSIRVAAPTQTSGAGLLPGR